ncbi:GNAT family N-acetyltransferase [Ktedonosporobacter rubrisoli]|uniref:GNAT family N-acetyltransferase n=1 Tax=Ktedonosporobacter rubrisoli TaxID=2509675 RepID=A0A4P6JME4_KTERU|nr:arsinothricin resistance N-acetyltransferase ArsN1 family A [Ktedonosporobacter rubrisoli]QBD75856.1 GNAT family N-acetyltransferase [Ktedonosporobacter rubrisoli]
MKAGELAPTALETRVLRMLRAMANPARFRIVALLAERKDCTSTQLAGELPLAQSSLFDHIALLRDAGIVQVSSEGSNRSYCLDPASIDFLAAYLSGLGQQARSWEGLVKTAQKEQHMKIREATRDDAAAIASIYNQGIEDRAATLETQLRTPEERAEWLAARGPRHPVLVAVDQVGTIVGWGSLNAFNPRQAYDNVVDFSVYVAREQRGRGLGDALLSALETRAQALGYHKMVLVALPTNAPGMRLYERHDFRTVGIYREQGMLDGRWVDVIIMEKILR